MRFVSQEVGTNLLLTESRAHREGMQLNGALLAGTVKYIAANACE